MVPDDDTTVSGRREQLICNWVPLERVYIAVVFSEDFYEAPIFDIRFLIGGEDENFSAEGAHGYKTTIRVPSEALDTWEDAICSRRGLGLL